MSTIAIIGSGFSGLSAAAYLSAEGHQVHVFEKNAQTGGRARQLSTPEGYIFDMGPSWYWMPDVFEKFFGDFGFSTADFYDLKLLDPSFDIIFGDQHTMHVPANFESLCQLFESIEARSSIQLRKFMQDAEYKYHAGMDIMVYKPGLSIREFADMNLLRDVFRLQVFSSFSKHVRKHFSHPQLVALMEFPVLFLGAMPKETPALYSLMNYAGLKLGTWYPMGGFGKITDGMISIARQNGAIFHTHSAVQKINIIGSKAVSLQLNDEAFYCDSIVAAADYHHVENNLLPPSHRNYDEEYWEKKTFAPSCLIYYLGINKKIKKLSHHNLFFEEDLHQHALEIYKSPAWPTQPLFYVCCPSKTDPGIAPPGHENIFILMPIAVGLKDNEAIREHYFQRLLKRIEEHTGENLLYHIDFKKSYCVTDFTNEYNSYKGNAYGLASTLRQTANLRPKIKNKKVENLFYSGQLTVPGPGVPPSIISGKIAAKQIINYLKTSLHEVFI
jgi:phytoene desaturase